MITSTDAKTKGKNLISINDILTHFSKPGVKGIFILIMIKVIKKATFMRSFAHNMARKGNKAHNIQIK